VNRIWPLRLVDEPGPPVIIVGVTTMEAVVGREMTPWRFSTWLFGLFAGLAFVLATVGLFGVVSLDVLHRSREFAVRLALGAQRRAILGRVLRSAALRVAVGVVLGAAVVAAASLLPARRAARIDPLTLLKQD
jgi:putative ABC transport system permease protein